MKKRFAALLLAGCLLTACSARANGPATAENNDSSHLEAVSTFSAAPPAQSEEDPAGEEISEEFLIEEIPTLTLEEIRTVTFQDVPSSVSYADCVSYVAHEGLLGGISSGHFDPDALVTRATVFTALYRMSGQEVLESVGLFDDMKAGAWYAGAVTWAVQEGLVDSGGNLGPQEPVRRSELAMLLHRLAAREDGKTYGSQLDAYEDAGSVPEEARESVAWALENRIFSALVTDSIHPSLPVSRAQLAQVLVALTAYNTGEPVAEALAVQMSAKVKVSLSQETHDSVQLLVDTVASKYGATSLQVAVVNDGKVVDTFTYGWATKDTSKMTPDHKIRVASITKVAVGVAAMLLREQGVIDLDTDIGPIWGIRARNPHYPDVPITIRSLLSHTSSIRAFEDTSRTRGAVKSQLSQSSGYSHMRPGAISSWNYNNYAFGVLGMTLELASGKYLDEVLDEGLWDIMDIDAAFESGCIDGTDLLATLYYHGGGVSRSVPSQKKLDRPESPGGTGAFFAGGLTISAKDLAKMTALLANDGYYEGLRLLSGESVELMETRDEHILGDGTYQALPLRSQDAIYGRDRLYYHTGSAYGVYNFMSYDPAAGDGVVMLSVGASGVKDERGIYAVCGDISSYIYEIIK